MTFTQEFSSTSEWKLLEIKLRLIHRFPTVFSSNLLCPGRLCSGIRSFISCTYFWYLLGKSGSVDRPSNSRCKYRMIDIRSSLPEYRCIYIYVVILNCNFRSYVNLLIQLRDKDSIRNVLTYHLMVLSRRVKMQLRYPGSERRRFETPYNLLSIRLIECDSEIIILKCMYYLLQSMSKWCCDAL